jgi:hypothetical protein
MREPSVELHWLANRGKVDKCERVPRTDVRNHMGGEMKPVLPILTERNAECHLTHFDGERLSPY